MTMCKVGDIAYWWEFHIILPIVGCVPKEQNIIRRRTGAVAQWLVRCAGDPVKAATLGLTPGQDMV